MSIEPSSFDAASTLQVRLKDACLGGLLEKQRETRRIKKKEIEKTPTILRLRPGTTKKNLLPKKGKLGGTDIHPKNQLDPVIQYFVPPMPLKDENYEAKEWEISQ